MTEAGATASRTAMTTPTATGGRIRLDPSPAIGTAGDRVPPPPMIDEFRIVELLGRGGMGAVYLAHDTVLDRAVALKLVAHRHAGDRGHGRFLVEARAIARLEHPNVVRIHRAATSGDGQPYLVQELLRGQTLDRLPRPLPPRRACELALGVARGLAAAHRLGILHRDVKPSNVMLTDDGAVKLLDFGIAKLGPGDRDPEVRPASLPVDLGLSTPGTIVGTPRYLAPELWHGAAASARSDIHALGVMLYELIAGTPPYVCAGSGIDALAREVTLGPAPRPLDGDDVPAALARLVARCLARSADERPLADEVVAHLEAILDDLPAPVDGNPYPGLAAFEATRRADFFGRADDVAAVVERLRGESLVAITGDSGIGKSSLCRAGVLPAIEAGALGQGRTWRCRLMTPGRRPAEALAAALGLDPGAALDLASVAPAAGDGLVLLVDQLEELITIADPRDVSSAARALAQLAELPGVRVLAAVRGDLLTRVGALEALGPALLHAIHLLRPLREEALRAAVVGPARARGVRMGDDAMVDELIAPVLADPSSLPLLQFALAALWDARVDDSIPPAALHRLGGVTGGFARHADDVLACLGADVRQAARRMVLACIDGRARVTRAADELCATDRHGAAALEALVRGRILVARDEPCDASSYTLVHETLIDGWPRLRNWIDERAGEQALRSRLRVAADDWSRAGRPRARLWSRGAVRGSEQLDGLTATERAFLVSSRRAARRDRLVAAVVVAAIPLAAMAAWRIVGERARAARAAEVSAHRDAAHVALAHGRDTRVRADAARAAAFASFTAGSSPEAERRWTEADELARQARGDLAEGAATLETALLLDPGDRDVRADLAATVHEQALLAESTGDRVALAELLTRLAHYDSGARLAAWHAPGHLRVDVTGARQVTVRAVQGRDGDREVGAPVATASGGRIDVDVAAGSLVVELEGADGQTIAAPVQLGRDERLELAFALPDPTRIPHDFVFVPPGRFVTGTDYDDFFRRDFLGAGPAHPASTGGFLIGRHEVTFGDWLRFLRALPPAERERRRPRTAAGELMAVRVEGDGPFTLMLQPGAEVAYRAREGEPIVYAGRTRRRSVRWEQLPVTGISADDVEAYAAWLATTGRVPGARLCRELEWERAARGADGRAYPHGDRLDPDDANIDVTYGRETLAFGPDEVGAHPASDSPFGVADLVGNVWEWVAGDDGTMLQRGGGWAHGASSALSANRDVNNPTMRHAWAGARICADLPPRGPLAGVTP